MGNNVKPGKYKHYKGKEYEVIGIAKPSETLKSNTKQGIDKRPKLFVSAFVGILSPFHQILL